MTPAASTSNAPPPYKPTSNTRRSFYDKDKSHWESLDTTEKKVSEETEKEKLRATSALKSLHEHLLSSLQMQHVIVLAGSGTSLGQVGGPSMWDVWDHCVNEIPGPGDHKRKQSEKASDVIKEVAYDEANYKENIEALLSQCEAYLQLKPTDDMVRSFVTESKRKILDKCSEFLDPRNHQQLQTHRTFLHRLSRRRVRDSRLKVFTTNYDLCFEAAAAKQGLVVIDGFSFAQPRHFDPRFFSYDIVRRSSSNAELGTPLEGVFQLYKLHGSVNWDRCNDGEVEVVAKPNPDTACLIYPARGKYQQSYVQPHLELVSQYFASLREPNTCLVVVGFGFNDAHLSEPILAAIRTNPHLRLIVVSPSAEKDAKGENGYWHEIFRQAEGGADVFLINATFTQFAELIPDLKSLTPAEQLARHVRTLSAGN